MLRSVEVNSLATQGTTRFVNSSSSMVLPICRAHVQTASVKRRRFCIIQITKQWLEFKARTGLPVDSLDLEPANRKAGAECAVRYITSGHACIEQGSATVVQALFCVVAL